MPKQFFNESMFQPTKWNSAADKAAFGNGLLNFILSGFCERQFTNKLYGRLMNCFGHIARYNKGGFYATWFSSTTARASFLEHLLRHPCWGDPGYTYSDVERAIKQEVRRLNLAGAYQQQATEEQTQRELALLARLKAKHQSVVGAAEPEPVSATDEWPSGKPQEGTQNMLSRIT
jgi:hypothetical protein